MERGLSTVGNLETLSELELLCLNRGILQEFNDTTEGIRQSKIQFGSVLDPGDAESHRIDKAAEAVMDQLLEEREIHLNMVAEILTSVRDEQSRRISVNS